MGRNEYRCKRKSCVYSMPRNSEFGCNYAGITGHTRLAQLPPDMHDPAVCPLYERGKRRKALMSSALPETAGRKQE